MEPVEVHKLTHSANTWSCQEWLLIEHTNTADDSKTNTDTNKRTLRAVHGETTSLLHLSREHARVHTSGGKVEAWRPA